MGWLVVAEVLGGAVLFLFGMRLLSGALRDVAGERLRALLTAATASRGRGLVLGTTVGFLAHSTAATAMTVGFTNAGLLSLASALPVLFGANVGTTLSMQVISFRLTDYAVVAVTLGGALYLAAPAGRWRQGGQVVFALGLLFFGMKVSGDAIVPHRAALIPWLEPINGESVSGMLLGIGIGMVVTVIIQSSGAVIGMTFVLAGAGVFASLWQTYPIVLGAHVGTSFTAIVASLGGSAEARRCAVANVGFNVGNAALGGVLAGGFVPLLERTSGSLVHQTANAHTVVMVVAALLALPFSNALARGLRRVAWRHGAEPAMSHLDPRLLQTPEDALRAAVREIGRCAALAVESFRAVLASLQDSAAGISLRRVRRNEQAVDQIRTSLHAYLRSLTRRALTARQALLTQSLHRCMVDLERIGDHVERLAELVGTPPREAKGAREEAAQLVRLGLAVVERMAGSWSTDDPAFDAPAWATIEARNRYQRECVPVKNRVTQRLAQRDIPSERALAFSEIAAILDRTVRHAGVIALEQRQPWFVLKPERLGRPAGAETADDVGPMPTELEKAP